MTETTVSKRGRPKGTRTATVELETLSFKVPAEFKTQLQTYAKQRRHSISELIREGVEWRIGEAGDPLNLRYGTGASDETAHEGNTGNTEKIEKGVEFLHGMLSALVVEVRQLRESMQVVEQRLEGLGSLQAPRVTGNAATVSVDGDIPVTSMEAQSTLTQTLAAEGMRGSIPPYDPAKHHLGKLCPKKHEWGSAEQSLRNKENQCLECKKQPKRKSPRRKGGTSGKGIKR